MESIKQSLKTTPLENITKVIKEKFLKKNLIDEELVKKIIQYTCKEYKLTKDIVINSRTSRGAPQQARNTILCIINIDYKVSERVASSFIDRGRTACRIAKDYFRSIDMKKLDKFDDDREFIEKYERIKKLIKK